MSKQKKYAGETSVSLAVFIQDTSSTTGAGLAGVTSASSGLVMEYRRQGQSSWTTVTPVAGKVLGTYLSGGIVADGSLAGAYEVDFPDAAFAAGAKAVLIRIRGVTNMLPALIEVELDAVNYQDSAAFGLSRLDQTISSRMASYTQPTGFLAATFPTTVASPTNITQASGVTLAATTHTGATIPTVTSITNGVTVSTNNDKAGYTATVSDKTGFKLASDGLAQVTAWTVAITGNLTGNVTGSVGSISGVTFPAYFGSLGINSSGHISRVVLVDTTTTNTDMRGTDGAALASAWTATRAGYLDGVLIAANYNQRTVSVTGSNHVAADIHESQAGSIHETTFDTNAWSARVLASDAVTEVVNGVWNEPTSSHTTAGTTGKALIDSGAAGNPWSTDLATGYSGTQAGNILNNVKSQTDLIQAGGTVTVSTPVTASGQLASPLIIGDDYLNANGRAFSWTVPLPSGFVIATSTAKFGMRYEDDQGINSFIQSGIVIDAGSGNVTLRFDVAKAVTALLRPGWYDWSVEIASASGTEITRVKSGKNAEWQEKQT